jgi:hypothetical protein
MMPIANAGSLFVCPACGQKACMLKPDKRQRPFYSCACGARIFPRGIISIGVMGAFTHMVEEMGAPAFMEMAKRFEEETIAAMQRLGGQVPAPTAAAEA